MYLGISRRFNFRETAGIGWWSKWPLSSNEKRLLSLPRKGERCYQSLGSRKGSNFNMYRRTDTQSALYLTPDCKHITKQTLTGNAATSSVLSNNRLPIRLREQTAAPPASPHSTSTVETPPHVSRMWYLRSHQHAVPRAPRHLHERSLTASSLKGPHWLIDRSILYFSLWFPWWNRCDAASSAIFTLLGCEIVKALSTAVRGDARILPILIMLLYTFLLFSLFFSH